MEEDPAHQMPSGLSEQEASERLNRIGPNRIAKPCEISFLGIAKEEITEPMILLLLGVGFFYTIFGELRDASCPPKKRQSPVLNRKCPQREYHASRISPTLTGNTKHITSIGIKTPLCPMILHLGLARQWHTYCASLFQRQ